MNVYEGEVMVDGVRASDGRPRIGYVPQLETIDWNFPVTVREVVMMGVPWKTVSSPGSEKRKRNWRTA